VLVLDGVMVVLVKRVQRKDPNGGIEIVEQYPAITRMRQVHRNTFLSIFTNVI